MEKNYIFIVSQITDGASIRYKNNGLSYEDIEDVEGDNFPTKAECDAWWDNNSVQVIAEQEAKDTKKNAINAVINENGDKLAEMLFLLVNSIESSQPSIITNKIKGLRDELLTAYQEYRQLN